MNRPLRVISIDGTRGAGKTSQISMLTKYFKSAGMVVSTLKMTDGDPVLSGIVTIEFAKSFLDKNNNNLVIIDGSIARPMVADMITGMSTVALQEKYKRLTSAYERLDHEFGVASFLMVMDDIEECNKRLRRKKALTGTSNNEVVDLIQEHDIVSGMRFFNNYIASKNIKFDVLDIHPLNSILDLNKSIITKLTEKYDFKKPKKDENDW